MTEQKQSENDPNVNIRMEKRDAETYVALGLFIVAVGIPVILGTYWAYPPDHRVAIVVSQGPAALVPDLTGMTEKEAENALSDAGLAVDDGAKRAEEIEAEIARLEDELAAIRKVPRTFDAKIAANRICAQEPPAGSPVEPQSGVRLVYSRGPAYQVKVPLVLNQPSELAKKKIGYAYLEVGKIEEAFDPLIPEGKVISQEPPAETKVDSGTVVNLIVSKGPEFIPAPPVISSTVEQAKQAFEAAGLALGPVSYANNSLIAEGIIISQSPEAGFPVASKTGIQVLVSSGKSPDEDKYKTSPPVVGKTQAEATAAIEAAGLRVAKVTKGFSGQVPAGSVISQNPKGGVSIRPNVRAATVNIVCAITLLAIGIASIVYGRVLLARHRKRS